MKEAFSTPGNRIKTFIFLGICVLLVVISVALGIADNPPGILAAFLGSVAFVLAFVHPWRAVKQFRTLFLIALPGLILFVILNNLFAYFAHDANTAVAFQVPLQVLAVGSFIIATLICPPAIVIGAVGWIVLSIKSHRSG